MSNTPLINTPFRHREGCDRRRFCGCMGTYPEARKHVEADYRITTTVIQREAYFSPYPNRAKRRRGKRRALGRPVSKPATRRSTR